MYRYRSYRNYRRVSEPCMCGATDCVACRGPGADCGPDEENSERPWLADSGYTLDDDGEWGQVVRQRIHVARRDHADGRVKRGDKYRVTSWRYINDESGDSYHRHRKTVIRRASAV